MAKTSRARKALAYQDIQEFFDRALASPTGVTAGPFSSRGEAVRFRQRANSWRADEREAHWEIYPEGHPERLRFALDRYVLSIRDTLVVAMPQGGAVRIVENPGQIGDLG